MKINPFKALPAIVLLMLGIHLTAFASDFETIYNRMYEKNLSKNPSQKSVEDLLALISSDGSFSNINYKATDGGPRKHVQNLITLACAYQYPGNAFFHNNELKEKYLKALNFWVDTNHQAKNWWYRFIPYPKELSSSVILMSEDIKQDQALFDKTMRYLRWSYENAAPSHMTGANAADIIMGSLAESVLTQNAAQMNDFKDRMTQLLTIQPVEGIQPDYLFAQHCANGRQLYFTSYGKEFVNSVLSYLEFCKDTPFQSPGVELLQKLFTDGVQWVFYSKQHDPNNAGRFISSDQYSGAIKALAERVNKLSNSETKDATKQALRHISGDNSLTGNRQFWRFDYMIHRRAEYMASSRLTSTRTVGNEAGNGDGNFNYYASNGVNYLFVTGQEYNRNFFKKFNNRQYPGITAEQDDAKLPVPDWGAGGSNGNSYAGGVSDSIYGACGMILDRRGLQAHKAWFYFDNEYVCLGSGINNAEGSAEVFTTLNQCNRDGKIQYAQNGKTANFKENGAPIHNNETRISADWVVHGSVGYFNLQPGTEYVLACDTALFSLNINHGVRPQNGTYAYLVRPDLSNASAASKYIKDIPVQILANTESVQAVYHKSLNITEVLFYQAGEVKLENGDIIRTDTPCALLWNANTQKLSVANPRCETENPETIQVTFVHNGQPVTLSYAMPQQEMAGRTVCQHVAL
ncbi:MAG: polysaccharide lyase family 8 super-sandwich domain-containing protein [Bacteroides sp.]|nr:polysaccharide lyase family 8 super-sandwich domain-containing protein [Bacteroides sp.]